MIVIYKEQNAGAVLRNSFAERCIRNVYFAAKHLILTSKEFNQQTMKTAEDDITRQVKEVMRANSEQYVTFDMTVSATFEVLQTDHLVETLQKVKGDLTKVDLEAVLKELQGKQEPRKCETVKYSAIVYIDGVKSAKVSSNTSTGDLWLKDLFNKK